MNKNSKLFFLNKKVLFPHCTLTVSVKSSELSSSLQVGETILTLPMKNFLDSLFLKSKTSVLAEILQIEKDNNLIKFQLRGISRVKLKKINSFHNVEYREISDENGIINDVTKDLKLKAQELIFLINVNESDRLIELINYLVNTSQITDFITNYFILDFKSRLKLLKQVTPDIRCKILLMKLDSLIQKIKISGKDNGSKDIKQE